MTAAFQSSLTRRLSKARALILLLGIALGIVATMTDIGAVMDRAIDPIRFRLLDREASGQIVVVEMDAASVAAIRTWPWPRRHYAAAVDRLRDAGASSIVFDVDFSSASNPHDDSLLAAAIARGAGLVALPTFAQQAGSGERRIIDTLPLPALRRNAALASVTMVPDSDGAVRYAPIGTVTGRTARPSLSAYVARRSGQAGRFFPIDYGIDPSSLPRLSFIAVRNGGFDPLAVRGRDVIIGATAIEMGDRYAAPRWGVIPGVIVQALGAETLLRGIPYDGNPMLALALAAILSIVVVFPRRLTVVAVVLAGSMILFVACVLGMQSWQLCQLPLAAGLLTLTTVGAGRFALHVIDRFRQQRMIDEATGLPNRRALIAAPPAGGKRLAIATICNFDALATILSENAMRDLTIRTTERLRMAADEAAIWSLSDRQLAFAVTEEGDRLDALRVVMNRPVEVHGRSVDVVLAIGIADIGEAGIVQAIADAGLASEQAAAHGSFSKAADRNREAVERDISLMGELDAGIEAGEIEVHYQPKLAIASGEIASAEALVRWRHPVCGFIGPDIFIPLAEQTGRIAALTMYVLATAMRDLATVRATVPALTVAVNISAKLVSSEQFNADVRRLLQNAPVPCSALIFEITESATIVDPVAATAALEMYRDLGIAISMDDYGTGQSTLSYLQRLPLSELKIDRSFVCNAHRNHNDAVLVRSTVDLAHQLGLKVVAEGIEDSATLAFLTSISCDMAQGYLISRPLTIKDFINFLDSKLELAA